MISHEEKLLEPQCFSANDVRIKCHFHSFSWPADIPHCIMLRFHEQMTHSQLVIIFPNILEFEHENMYLLLLKCVPWRPVYTGDFCCDFSGDFCCDFKRDFAACKLLAIQIAAESPVVYTGDLKSPWNRHEIAAKIASVNGSWKYFASWFMFLSDRYCTLHCFS